MDRCASEGITNTEDLVEQGTQMLLLLPSIASCDWKNNASGTSPLINNRYNNHNSPNPPLQYRITWHRKVNTRHFCLSKPPENSSPFLDGLSVSATAVTTQQWKQVKPRASMQGLREILILQLRKLTQTLETVIFMAQELTYSPKATMALHR